MIVQKVKQKRQKKTVEDADFLLFNTDEDTAEIIEVLGLDNRKAPRYDDDYANDNY